MRKALSGRLNGKISNIMEIFSILVSRFDSANPQFSTDKGMLKQTAFFLQRLQDQNIKIPLEDHFVTDVRKQPSVPKMKKSLNYIYSNAYNLSTDDTEKSKMKSAYKEAISGVVMRSADDSTETIKQNDIRRSRSPKTLFLAK